MAAYAALVSLLNNIDQITKHPSLSTSLDNEQIQPLVEKAAFLLDFIEEYKYGGGSSSNKEAEDLERQIASAAHAAEDVIESHIVDQIHAAGTNLGCSLDLQQIMEDMDAVMEKAAEVKEKQATHSRSSAVDLTETRESNSTHHTRMVGLDDELNQILDELTGNKHPSSLHAISIVGMGGMGKTTFAKNVYENSYIMQHFVIRAWATVSEQHDAKNILTQLLSCLVKPTDGRVDELGDQLHKSLMGKTYLIVLDDVWSVEAWDNVRRFLPDIGNRSRVVLTTRLSNVTSDCRSSLFRMNLLDEEKSWVLFCEKIVIQHGHWPSPHLEEIGKEIVKQCKGLALSIVVIGGLLRKAPRTVEHWESVVRDIISIGNSKEKEDTLDVLSLSYYHLPPHLKPCFLYMGVFKEDSEIRVSKIVKLWVGEGFVKIESGRVLEEIAKGYLKDLIDRNLVLVGRLRQNGKIGSCRIHDLLRDLCIKLGEQQQFFRQGIFELDHLYKTKFRTERRLFFHEDSRNPELPHARSILIWRPNSEVIVGRLVRVLDAQFLKFWNEIYGCFNLRYISYKQPRGDRHPRDRLGPPWNLPSSMSLVWNLQTLIFCSDGPLIIAPDEIWKMRQLWHVQCNDGICLPDPPPSNNEEVVLDSLQTLQIVKNLRLSEKVCKMIPNIKKLHLLYEYPKDDGLIECLGNLDCLLKLESLKFTSFGYKFNKNLRFPRLLNKLSLKYCEFHWDELTIIGSLPQLKVLVLEHRAVTKGERWSPIEGQFKSLKFLKINCGNLHCWDTDSSHFPVLEKLHLNCLRKLEEIPLDIGNISTLQLIHLNHCSESATISAVKIKEEQLENQGDDCQLQIHVIYTSYEPEIESFKERLETEGLSLESFQLETRF